jgi:hypothetical protein
MKKLLLVAVLFLSGCSCFAPVQRKFPEVPKELKVACPDLNKLEEGTTKLSDVVSVVAKNYGQYQECQIKVDAWNDWYKKQKDIYEGVK